MNWVLLTCVFLDHDIDLYSGLCRTFPGFDFYNPWDGDFYLDLTIVCDSYPDHVHDLGLFLYPVLCLDLCPYPCPGCLGLSACPYDLHQICKIMAEKVSLYLWAEKH